MTDHTVENDAPCTCPRMDGYRIKRRGCPAHADKDAAYWQSVTSPAKTNRGQL